MKSLQEFDKNNTFKSSSTPSFYKGEPKSRAGTNKGLMVVLDAHNDLVSAGSVDGDFNTFIGVIANPGSFPLTNLRGFHIRPGNFGRGDVCIRKYLKFLEHMFQLLINIYGTLINN